MECRSVPATSTAAWMASCRGRTYRDSGNDSVTTETSMAASKRTAAEQQVNANAAAAIDRADGEASSYLASVSEATSRVMNDAALNMSQLENLLVNMTGCWREACTWKMTKHACDRAVRDSRRPAVDRARMLSEGSMFQQTLMEALHTMAEAQARGEQASAPPQSFRVGERGRSRAEVGGKGEEGRMPGRGQGQEQVQRQGQVQG